MALTIYVDGACFGNPGPMGIGAVIYKDRKKIKEISEFLGNGTNNIAEYTAAIRVLEEAHKLKEKNVHIKSDSMLFVKQLQGKYKVKAPHLKELNRKVHALCLDLNVTFEHIPREQNEEADALSKEAIENKSKE